MKRTHTLWISALTLLLAVALLQLPADAQKLLYPKTKKVDQIDTYFGTKIADPHRWLEDDNSAQTEQWKDKGNKHLIQLRNRARGAGNSASDNRHYVHFREAADLGADAQAATNRQEMVFFDLSSRPVDAPVLTATLEPWQEPAIGAADYLVGTRARTVDWRKLGVARTTLLPFVNLDEPDVLLTESAGWKVWDISKRVQRFLVGDTRNNGILLLGDPVNPGLFTFRSREYADSELTPRLTKTPSAIPSPTATIALPPLVDLYVDGLEVTQGVQDLYNSVPLVAGKRTFVRMYVHSSSSYMWTYAMLKVKRGATEKWLSPVNGKSGHIFVRPYPARDQLDESFLFELPHGYRDGTVTITAELNPVTFWRERSPIEVSYSNNTITTTVSFGVGRMMPLVVYNVNYRLDNKNYSTSKFHIDRLRSWLGRAYPVSVVMVTNRVYNYGLAAAYQSGDLKGELYFPNCGSLNMILQGKQLHDTASGWVLWQTHYYAMVSDDGGWMRGCAPLPGIVASGPTGFPKSQMGAGWDVDGSYGDWYGGHELGHSYGRKHVQCSGDEAKPDFSYPYLNGRISPTLYGSSAIYGFDAETRQVYGPDWNDVMTYCDKLWLSDYTYKGFFYSIPWFGASERYSRKSSAPADRLLVLGVINPASGQTELQPLFVIPNAPDIKPAVPGSYSIVLRNAADAELARYPFTPADIEGGPGPTLGRNVDLLAIQELVPYVAGTTRVDVEGPGRLVLKSVTAGAAGPTVTVQSPNGGEILDGGQIRVSWTASDPDNDPLTFNVQYSPNNGTSWELLAQNITGANVTLDASDFTGGAQARIRVSVSDGIHTSSDDSDGTFVVPNHVPSVAIVQPQSTVTIALSQTLGLEADAYDVDTGTMLDQQVSWASSLDGPLGTGNQLSVADLSLGTHTITATADDGIGGVALDRIVVTVVENTEPSPPPMIRLFLPIVAR